MVRSYRQNTEQQATLDANIEFCESHKIAVEKVFTSIEYRVWMSGQGREESEKKERNPAGCQHPSTAHDKRANQETHETTT